MAFTDSKQRFSTRVADYVRYRPGYPHEALTLLKSECGLSSGQVIADIGSGTGFLSELFLKNGNRVYGIEPNKEMREAGEEYLAAYDSFGSIDASAEATTLEDATVDFVTVGQAFHWFDVVPTRREFSRILKPESWVVVMWNDREMNSAFATAYEDVLVKLDRKSTRLNSSHRSLSRMPSSA